LASCGARAQRGVTGAVDAGPQRVELGGQAVRGGGLPVDVAEQGLAHLVPPLGTGRRLVIGDGYQEAGHDENQRHQHLTAQPPSSRCRNRSGGPFPRPLPLLRGRPFPCGAGVGGLLVGGVQGLGEHLVEQ
jgi:hypothetical protein